MIPQPITGHRLTPHTVRVYLTLLHFGPMRAAQLARLLYPDLAGATWGGPVVATLGKLKRCGLVGWSVYDGRYVANRCEAMDRVLTGAQ